MLPTTERLLLGPGPSPISAAVREALSAPPRSHLDPDLTAMLDAIRNRLERIVRAPSDSLVLAVSGTGTAALEAAVANLVEPGTRALAIVTGYFGARLAEVLQRYGASVDRIDVEWGRSVDPDAVAAAFTRQRYQVLAIVHAETSTGVRNPLESVARIAGAHDALVIADTVSSLGAVPFDMAAWGVDACYSCSQKVLGAPPGLSPLALSPKALSRRVSCRSFYLDADLLASYWIRRAYHHTISSPLVYALATALTEVEDEGLEARWARHEHVHKVFVEGLAAMGLDLLPAPADRLWNLNAVQVPDGVAEAAIRSHLLSAHGIEVGAGLGPLAGKIWRVGLMGGGATVENVARVHRALESALRLKA